MRNAKRVAAAGVTLALTGLSLVACSGGGGGGGGGAGGGGDQAADIGPITVVQGKDNNGFVPVIAKMWNAEHPKEKVTFKQQSTDANQQLQDLTLHFQQKSADYDVVSSDVVWTQEFAAKGYLVPLTGKFAIDTAPIVPAVLNTAKYRGVLYAAPFATDSQILYYRKDLLGDKPVPKTFDDMFKLCDIAKKANINCYTGQFKKYEGLTVNFAEAVNSAGGTIVDDQGKPTLDTPEAKAGLTKLVDAFQKGYIPKSAISNDEEAGRAAFEAGKYLFYTNWPYAYSLTLNDGGSFAKKDPSALGIAGFPGKSSLGGHNWGISQFSKHKGTALKFLKWFQSEKIQTFDVEKTSAAPVLSSLYSNDALNSKFKYLPVLKDSLDNAVPRPGTPYYTAVTTAIQENAYAALKGSKSVDQALKDMASSIEQASAS
jgi:multiple sugar transport system substrate-binding protein